MIFGDFSSHLDTKSIKKKMFFFAFFGLIMVCAIELSFSFSLLIIASEHGEVFPYYFTTLGLISAEVVMFVVAYLVNLKKPVEDTLERKENWYKIALRSLSVAVGVIFIIVGMSYITVSYYAYSLAGIGFMISLIQIPSIVLSIIKCMKKPAKTYYSSGNATEFVVEGEIENAPSSNSTEGAIEVESRDINEA